MEAGRDPLSPVLERLSNRTLQGLPPTVATPAYARVGLRPGVVHFGPGAFHRAHQAYYFDRMLARDAGYGVCAVSLRSDDLRAALEPQDGLYSLIEREAEPTVRVIGSLIEVLTAPRAPERAFARLADPAVRIVTATVTEKGYCLTPAGDLDTGLADISRDLEQPLAPGSMIGWLVEGLRRRRAAGGGGLTAISCDNLSDNGGRFRRAVLQMAVARGEHELARWIEDQVRFPSTMVDSITPATDEALRAQAAAALGLEDAWPIQRERFVQWVVEHDLGPDAAAFTEAGVTLTGDVAAFERAKLRLLNGPHSTLAYIGLALGLETVSEAMADARLARFIETMMRREIAPALPAAQGLDLDPYIGQILARFRNPAIAHRLSQIAWDGSQKLPFRLLEPISAALAAGLPIDHMAAGVAAWMAFARRQARAGAAIVDPISEALIAAGLTCVGEASADVGRFLQMREVFPDALVRDARFTAALERAYALVGGAAPEAVLAA